MDDLSCFFVVFLSRESIVRREDFIVSLGSMRTFKICLVFYESLHNWSLWQIWPYKRVKWFSDCLNSQREVLFNVTGTIQLVVSCWSPPVSLTVCKHSAFTLVVPSVNHDIHHLYRQIRDSRGEAIEEVQRAEVRGIFTCFLFVNEILQEQNRDVTCYFLCF